MKYIDRKGNITIEENEQDKFLRHLYNDRGGRLCLKLLIRPFVSKAAGVLLNTRLSARFVPDFVKNNKIDLSIYEKQNFSSWNDFFIRRIRKEERPIDMRENILISPCDGKLSVHRISSDSRFSIKDTEYTAGQLLKNKAIAERYTGGYDYFTTTLSISPLKNAAKINEIGEELAEIYHVQHLPSDFKKKNGYKRSIELSHEYDLYRQNYCGCVYSRREAENRK